MRELVLAGALVGTMAAVVVCGTVGGCGREGAPESGSASSSATGVASTPGTGGAGSTVTAAASLPEEYGVSAEEWAEYVASGTALYGTTCVACHGMNGVGIPGLGKPLANSQFVQGQDDDALLAFIQKGRDPSDPANTTGIGMPAKGGNPALSEDDILDIIAYLRTLQGT